MSWSEYSNCVVQYLGLVIQSMVIKKHVPLQPSKPPQVSLKLLQRNKEPTVSLATVN